MLGWMCYFKEDSIKNSGYIKMYQEEGKKLDIEIELVYVEDLSFGVLSGVPYVKHKEKSIEHVDFIVNRSIYPLLSMQFEAIGIPVFNSSKVSMICNDKAKTYQYISKLNIPMVDTRFCLSKELLDVLDAIHTPTVIKAVAGHGGSQVFLYGTIDGSKSEEIIAGIGNSDFVVQPLTGTRREDLRVYVIGGMIVTSILRKGKDSFKSNFSLGGEVREYHLSDKEQSLVMKIIEELPADMIGIDFIIGDDGTLIFNEIEDVVGARMLYQCTNINLVGRYLEYIKNKIIEKQANNEISI